MTLGPWQILWYWRWSFRWNRVWPREGICTFRYWHVGPVEVRYINRIIPKHLWWTF